MSSISSSSSEPNYKLFTVTLSLPSISAISSNTTAKNKKDSHMESWESICQKWGMNIARELVYVQNSVLEEHDLRCIEQHGHHSHSNRKPNHNSSSSIIVDGCEALKIKDQLVISNLIDQNGNKLAKLDDENGSRQSKRSMDSYKYGRFDEIPFSTAQNVGIEPGDVIYAVYSMKNPTLGLLYRIMKHSETFQ